MTLKDSISKDNKAGRLYEIFETARNISINANDIGIVVWGNVFNIISSHHFPETPEAEFEILSRIFQLQKLIEETKKAILNLEDVNHILYLQPFDNLTEVISYISLSRNPYSKFLREKVSNSDAVILRFCADLLHKHYPEKILEQEELSPLLEDISVLYESVLNSSLHYELKKFLLENLEEMRRAIHEYRIGGIDRLQKTFENTVGSLIINQDLIKSESDKEEVKNFGKVFSKFSSAVAFASHTIRLLEAAKEYLPYIIS